MPNWCDTTYRAVGNKEQVKKFYDLVMMAYNKPESENGGWLGHIVAELGGDWKDISCRGWIETEPSLNYEGDMCTVSCSTAWGEPCEWREFVEGKLDGLFLYYTAIEPGCGVFITNDEDVDGMFFIDSTFETYGEFFTEEQVIDFVNNNFCIPLHKKRVKTIDEALQFMDDYDDTDSDRWAYIHQMEWCE